MMNRILLVFIFSLFLINSLWAQDTLSVSTPCSQALTPIVTALNMDMTDLFDTTNKVNQAAMTLKKHLIETGQWETISAVCNVELGNTCNDCSQCHCSVLECCYWGACYVCDAQCCGGLTDKDIADSLTL